MLAIAFSLGCWMILSFLIQISLENSENILINFIKNDAHYINITPFSFWVFLFVLYANKISMDFFKQSE